MFSFSFKPSNYKRGEEEQKKKKKTKKCKKEKPSIHVLFEYGYEKTMI